MHTEVCRLAAIFLLSSENDIFALFERQQAVPFRLKRSLHRDQLGTRLKYDFLREEVTLPHDGGMTFDELIPSTRTAFRAKVKPSRRVSALERQYGERLLDSAFGDACTPAG